MIHREPLVEHHEPLVKHHETLKTLWNIMKHSNTRHSSFDATILELDAETSALDMEMSAFSALTSAIALRSFDATISAFNAETSVLGAATSAIARSYRLYRHGVFSDCGVGVTPQMCNRVTNHEDMCIFSRPELWLWVVTSLLSHRECENLWEVSLLDSWMFTILPSPN